MNKRFEEAAADGRIFIDQTNAPPCPRHEGACDMILSAVADSILRGCNAGSHFDIVIGSPELAAGRYLVLATDDIPGDVRQLHCRRVADADPEG